MSDGETLVEAALRVLNTADPVEKAKLGDQIANNWLQGVIANPYNPSQPDLIVPDRPARLSNVSLPHYRIIRQFRLAVLTCHGSTPSV